MKNILIILLLAALIPAAASAGLKKVDISPMLLINLDQDERIDSDGRFLGGAVAGDFYFSQHFALRASVGYVKNLYNTSVSTIDQLFDDAQVIENRNYSLRFSIAPYADVNVGGILRPYATLTGGVGYMDNSSDIANIGAVNSDVLSNSRYVTTRSAASGYYDFTGALGVKIPVAANLSVFSEISHRLYSSLDINDYYSTDGTYRLVPFGFDQYKTLLSVGMTYSIGLGGR